MDGAEAKASTGSGAIAVTPDGRRAVSISKDRTLKIWKLDSGAPLATAILDEVPQCLAVAAGDLDRTGIVAGGQAGGIYVLEYVEPDAGE